METFDSTLVLFLVPGSLLARPGQKKVYRRNVAPSALLMNQCLSRAGLAGGVLCRGPNKTSPTYLSLDPKGSGFAPGEGRSGPRSIVIQTRHRTSTRPHPFHAVVLAGHG